MAIDNVFTDASIVMTVVSLTTFLGILCWTYCVKSSRDFDAIARLPFDDDDDDDVHVRMEEKDQKDHERESDHG